nr:zinc finger protein RFP-like [Chrysemys picta bellii]
MAAENPMESLQEQATCPICLEYFKDPVIIDCGHNFCRACIRHYWEGSDTAASCLQCRETVQQRNLRPNRQLANMVEIAKRLSLQAAKGAGGERVCGEHQETLKLFCEKDQTPICVVCHLSPTHRAHKVVPIEEAVQEYKKHIEKERQKIVSEFQQLRQFLEEQERLLLAQLEKLEEVIDVRSTLSRCEKGKFQQSVKISPELEKGLHVFSQKTVALMETLREFKDTLPYELETKRGEPLGAHRLANVTLDPDTAHPQLVLSEDRKSVRWGDTRQRLPNNPERFDYCFCVLGCEGFTSGRHCWEVEVRGGEFWAVGVARVSVRRKGWISLSPEGGIWAVQRCGGQLRALTSPETPLPLSRVPSRIRVYLDCNRGQVTFINAADEAPIFTFPPGSIPGERIRRWLWVGRGSRLRLCR